MALGAAPAAAAGGSGGTGLGGSTTTTTTTTTSGTTPASTTQTSTVSTAVPKRSRPKRRRSGDRGLLSRVLGSRMLALGMAGPDVTVLQRDLTALNFKVPASGRFNAQTLRRLKQFQRHYGLAVDGVAGPDTIGELKRLLSRKLHIAQSALQAEDLAAGVAVTATSSDQPLPAGDSGLTGGVGLGTTTGSDSTSGTQPSTALHATLIDGIAVPAPGTPPAIVTMLDAANSIAFDPYIYGGGHASFISPGYDCSGSVSFVLHAGGLLATPLDSEQFMQYGLPGRGTWITIYTNGPTHAYMEIAGLWFDTAAQTALNGNDRWSLTRIGEPGYGHFFARHPAGW